MDAGTREGGVEQYAPQGRLVLARRSGREVWRVILGPICHAMGGVIVGIKGKHGRLHNVDPK